MTDAVIYDVSTFPDLDPTGGAVSRPRAIAERVARRYTTPRGRLEHAPDDGLDLRAQLSRGVAPSDLPDLSVRMRLEAEKDEEVERATVSLALDDALEKLSARVALVPVGDDEPVVLTLAITKLSVDLLTIG